MYKEMIQYKLVKNEIQPDIFTIAGVERPPIIEIPEYRQKFYPELGPVCTDQVAALSAYPE